MESFTFHVPTRIAFGEGRIAELAALLPGGIETVLVVTDRGVAQHSGALEKVLWYLGERSCGVFDQVEENPSFATVAAGARRARQDKAQAIIGLGGGSPMDVAKGIAVLATNDGEISDFVGGTPGANDPLPVICVPTTSGTGSEVTPYAVFTDPQAATKVALSHPAIFPVMAVIDPALTFSMPPPLVIATGLDALTHAVEAFLSTEAFPMNDLVAVTAIRTVLACLPAATALNHEAMSAMAYSAMLGGIAISHASTILPHVMGYPLTVLHGMPHGLASAVLLPEFCRFLRTHSSAPTKVERLEQLFAPHGGVVGFLAGLGVSCRLAAYGVREEEIATFVPKVMVKGDVAITPAPVTEDAVAAIYRASL